MANWLDSGYRRLVLDEIRSSENQGRKAESFKQSEIQNDRLDRYVKDKLLEQFTTTTMLEMPVVSSVNVQRRIVSEMATVYTTPPEREFTDITEDQKITIDKMYDDARANIKLNVANEIFKYQDQCLLWIMPNPLSGILEFRTLKGHQYDVIPMPGNPEIAKSIIISIFDRDIYTQQLGQYTRTATGYESQTKIDEQLDDRRNDKIADKNDYQQGLERYIVWDRQFHFVMDGNGMILDDMGNKRQTIEEDEIMSPLAETGELPFVDIFLDKDFEYFVRATQSVTDFTVEFCAQLSSLFQVVKMNGFSQAWLKGPADLMPTSIQVGPNYILRLAVDPDTEKGVDFGFANPGADISGTLQAIEAFLSYFLSSRGIDPKTISGAGESTKFSSGIERLLALFEKFEASKSDFAVFDRVEVQIYELLKTWLNVLQGTNILKTEFQFVIPETSQVNVKFNSPEAIKTEAELLEAEEKKIDLGVSSRIRAIMNIHDVDREKAIEMAKEFDEDEGLFSGNQETEILEEGGFPGDQPARPIQEESNE